jgi:hypothetical protein
MKKSMSIVIQVTVLLVIALASILYIMKTSPVENLGEYEKEEMVRPNKTSSMMDTFFKGDEAAPEDSDNHSLTGASGRYDEVRIGKSSE